MRGSCSVLLCSLQGASYASVCRAAACCLKESWQQRSSSSPPVGADAKPLLQLDVEASVPQIGHRQLEWLGKGLHLQADSCCWCCLLHSCLAGCGRQSCCFNDRQHSRQWQPCLPCCLSCRLAMSCAIDLQQRLLWLLLSGAAALLRFGRGRQRGCPFPHVQAVLSKRRLCCCRRCHQAPLPGSIAV